jgi:hypothetical protein
MLKLVELGITSGLSEVKKNFRILWVLNKQMSKLKLKGQVKIVTSTPKIW